MSSPETLLQAAFNRLAARMGSTALDAAAQLSLMAQDAPQKLHEELQQFWAEVQQEAQRMDKQGASAAPGTAATADAGLQQQLDQLRQQVGQVARRLEEPN
jgi:DNA anti-recombination protein RmuC